MPSVLGKVLRGTGYLLLVLFALAALVSLLRNGTTLQYVGQFLTATAGGPILIVLIGGGLLSMRRWAKKRERVALGATILSALGAVSCAFILSGYVEVARQQNVPLDIARIFWPGPFGYSEPQREDYVFDRFNGEEAKLLVYKPIRRAETKGAPILVYVHGGGWIVGDAADRGHDLQWFARKGYLVIAVNYTLSSDKRNLWDTTQPQIGCALAWISQNAERLGGDAERIAMIGESAGGNIALNTASLAYRGRLQSRCGGQVPKVQAIIAVYPPTDLVALYSHEPVRNLVTAYTGGTPGQFPERYATVSPMRHVQEPAPPLLLITGLDDSVVPLQDMLLYIERARAAGQKAELITVPRAGHGFEIIPGSIGHQILMKSTDAFLKRNGMAP